jgi:hypothetical protein
MERRREQNPDRRIMEEIPQEPIAADPTDGGEGRDDENDDL